MSTNFKQQGTTSVQQATSPWSLHAAPSPHTTFWFPTPTAPVGDSLPLLEQSQFASGAPRFKAAPLIPVQVVPGGGVAPAMPPMLGKSPPCLVKAPSGPPAKASSPGIAGPPLQRLLGKAPSGCGAHVIQLLSIPFAVSI